MSDLNLIGFRHCNRGAFSRMGICVVQSDKGSLIVFADPEGQNRIAVISPKEGTIGSFLLRSFPAAFGDGLRTETELLYTIDGQPDIRRLNVTTNLPGSPIRTRLRKITCLAQSQDGRYLGVGDTNGVVQSWCMDGPEPWNTGTIAPEDVGAVVSISYDPSNVELYVAYSHGGYMRMRPSSNTTNDLNNTHNRACYTIAHQPDGPGIAFGGDGKRVWFLNLPVPSPEPDVHDVPFGLQEINTVTGTTLLQVAGLPGATVGYIDTGIESYIEQLAFLPGNKLLVVAQERAELWDLSERCFLEQVTFNGLQLLGAGRVEGQVWVALRAGGQA